MEILQGNIFTSPHQTIVNTINCVGVMGAGIAFEFRLRYPVMYRRYVDLCRNGQINVGTLWIFRASPNRWVLNFPTKKHWRDESKVEYLEAGLLKFKKTYAIEGITSIAFPMLGASHGGLSEQVSLSTLEKHLREVKIPISVYRYDPEAYDDLYLRFRAVMVAQSDREVAKRAGIRTDLVRRVKLALDDPSIRSLGRLAGVRGIGLSTLEKCFQLITEYRGEGDQLEFGWDQAADTM